MGLFSKFKKKSTEQPTNEPIPKLEFKGGTKYASNELVDAYIDFEELGGYPFVKTVLLGVFSVRTKKSGCTLTFIFENDDTLNLSSDNNHVESEQINKSPIHFTPVDFEITDEELALVQQNKVVKVLFKFKKETLELDKI